MIKIFGHKSPDTDSACSPIVYAWYLSNKKDTPAKPYIAGEVNRETEFIFKKFNIEKPEVLEKVMSEDKIIILDTNNPEELPSGVDKAEIIEIVDHHKLSGGLSTEIPIRITIRPVACVATILWSMMKQEGDQDIPKDMVGLMLSSILSDTLKFTSPTTTQEDENAAQELAEKIGEDIDKLAEEMFEAKSDLSGMEAKDILLSDSKVFEIAGKKVRISVLETTKPDNALVMKDELKAGMKHLKKEENLNLMFFFAVDILKTASDLIVSEESEEDIAKKAFGKGFTDGKMHLDGVVSRKKQIVPNIEKAIK